MSQVAHQAGAYPGYFFECTLKDTLAANIDGVLS